MLEAIVRHIEAWIDRHFIGFTVTGLFLLFIVVYFADNIFITIPPGHGGALWLRFFGGTVIGMHFGEGIKIIPPWDRIYIYDLRVRQESEKFDVLTKEGLQIAIDVTLRFRLNPRALGVITRLAGPDFLRTLVMPTVGATVRSEAAKHTLEEIYSLNRHKIEADILMSLSEAVDELIAGEPAGKPEIIVQDFWFRSIVFPENLRYSIEAKLAQRQLAEQYIYILEREEREKQRKMIEAEGIKAFQDTVSNGISENYLRWKGIDATLKLAESPNSKIVVIGAGKEGLPLILGPWEPLAGVSHAAVPASGAEASAQKPAAPSASAEKKEVPTSNPYLQALPWMPQPPAGSAEGLISPKAPDQTR